MSISSFTSDEEFRRLFSNACFEMCLSVWPPIAVFLPLSRFRRIPTSAACTRAPSLRKSPKATAFLISKLESELLLNCFIRSASEAIARSTDSRKKCGAENPETFAPAMVVIHSDSGPGTWPRMVGSVPVGRLMAAELKIERSSHTENNSRREVELTKLLAAQDVSELT